MPILEIPGLTQAEADGVSFDLSIDGPQIDVIPQPDGKFTVRATYPEGAIIPTPSNADDRAPFEVNGLTQQAADAEEAYFRDSGATVQVIPEGGDRFTVRITPAPVEPYIPTAPPADPNAPQQNGFVFCVDRIRTEQRAGFAFPRTVSRYQAYINGAPLPGIFGMSVERQGPGDNSDTGVSRHRRIAAGTYPLLTHDGASNERYKTIGYHTPANPHVRPWPSIRVGDTGARSGILIHCASGYLMSIGCINLAANVIDASTNLIFSDSWNRVVGLIDAIRDFLGADFPSENNRRLPNTFLIVRDLF